MLLAGDIGGTKTELAVFSPERGLRAPLAQQQFDSANYPGLPEMVREFLAQVRLPVERACFDVAGPVMGGAARLTNLPWVLEEEGLKEALGLKSVRLINDLVAIASAVVHLEPSDLHTLSAGVPEPGGSIGVIAPGTGLGEAFLTWDGSRYRAYPSEGGHASFAPSNLTQIEILRYLLDRFEHVSFERVCSGIGLPNLYDALKAMGHGEEPPELAARIAQAADRTPVIVQAALDPAGPSPLCSAALETFVAILGSEAGNLALKVLATGGVYLGGGIPRRILPALEQGPFMAAFRGKGRMRQLLERIPVHVIVSRAALIGAASVGLEEWYH